MKKISYIKISAKDLMTGNSVDLTKLNDLGKEGWELCYVTNWNGQAAWFYFKRQEQ